MSVEPEPVRPVPALFARRRRLVLGIALGLIVALGAAQIWRYLRLELPLPDLTGVDPEVVEAIESARDDVLAHRSSADAWGYLGKVLHAHDFLGEASRCYRQAELLNPRDPRWPYFQGILTLNSDVSAALASLERASGLSLDGPSTPRLRAVEALFILGRLDEAEGQLKQGLDSDPVSNRGRLCLGRIALARADWRAALEHLQPCLADEHCRRLARTLRAEAWIRLGDAAQAREELRQAAQFPEDQTWPDPFLPEVARLQRGLRHRLAEADSLWRQGRLDEAIELLQQTLARYPNTLEAQTRLGEIWLRTGKSEQAERVFEAAVRSWPEATEAWFGLGCLQARGRPRTAVASFREALRWKPDHLLAHYNLARCLKELGDPKGAMEEFQAALRCRPDFGPALEGLAELERNGRSHSGQ